MNPKQISRPVYNRIVFDAKNLTVKPKAITVHPNIYKLLCKEMKHKVRIVYGMVLTNFYDKTKS
ncbi:hypothetical protein UFOVP388_32 [uncultured Caudovirales phage]|uniref:Uncharacterized protein n=1 Tax=uncultured Caudovirales phage TaxID=2100421 RepID=A0A6J7X3M9_9CAUD|nr:hypothetical protein UFOVP388_32 [uncultured Caudovirales phage]